jgi:hypothetical protein
MDTFTVTGYNASTGVATITFNLIARPGLNAATYTGVKIYGAPKDTVANVKSFLRSYADAFIAGKIAEGNQQSAISSEVAALLNVATDF